MPDPRESLCFALDVPSAAEAEKLVGLLSDRVGVFKVGLQLFVREGPPLLSALKAKGAWRIFLDLKLLDIPRTVREAQRSAAGRPVDFLSVHSEALLDRAALPESSTDEHLPKLLGVTLLTSLGQAELSQLGYRQDLAVQDIVLMRAAIARQAGCAGVVCSGQEVKRIRQRLGPGFLLVTPGIRPSWTEVKKDDQARTRTPREAISDGADILVVGRPIAEAPDPLKAAEKILEEIEQGYRDRTQGS